MARAIFFYLKQRKIVKNEKVADLKVKRGVSLSCSVSMTVENIALITQKITV